MEHTGMQDKSFMLSPSIPNQVDFGGHPRSVVRSREDVVMGGQYQPKP